MSATSGPRRCAAISRALSAVTAALMLVVGRGQVSAQAPSTLVGIVRDSSGQPVPDAEVTIRDLNHAVKTNAAGRFSLDVRDPGSYAVSFRRLGYRSVSYTWRAIAGQRTEISVALFVLSRELDPVVVRAEEDSRASARASLLGLVVDTAGVAIPEAAVDLLGADISGTTRANGGFLFKPLAIGTYVLRVRKLGFAPGMLTVQLGKNDDREVVVYLHPLAANLDPFVVTERSGYGRDQTILDEFERRKRFQTFQTRLLGPEDLKGYYGRTLDQALLQMGLYRSPHEESGRPTSLMGPLSRRSTPDLRRDDACILLNGKDPIVRPLTSFSTDEIEMLEVYPPQTELSGTVSWHFYQPACKPLSVLDHPTYFVVWLKHE